MNPRLVLITGGSRGIGFETAKKFLALGDRVALLARDPAILDRAVRPLIDQYGAARVQAIPFDVSNADGIPAVFNSIQKHFGTSPDILVNNAAIGERIELFTVQPADFDRVMNVNVRAVFFFSQEFARHLKARGEPGVIVNLSSLGGIRGTEKFPGMTPYTTSKFAVVGLTEAFASELKSCGIRVNAIAPGAVNTEMLKKAAPDLRTETEPSDIADLIVWICDRSSRTVSGSVLEVFSNLT